MLKKGSDEFCVESFILKIKKYYLDYSSPVIKFFDESDLKPFQILVCALLSSRTKDEITAFVSKRLFELVNTPYEILELKLEKIEKILYSVGFFHVKSRRIIEISRILIEKYGGVVPNDFDKLCALPGVGRKTANLVLSEGFNVTAICVDVHVHRITNRLGYVKTKTPTQTEFMLMKKLPIRYWRVWNKLLVSFGKIICCPISPKCTKCPVFYMCKSISVIKFR